MVLGHIYGNVVTVRPTSGTLRNTTVDDDDVGPIIKSVGMQDVVALSAGLLALSGESQLVDCTVHHNRVELIDDPRLYREGILDEGVYRLFVFGGGAVFKRGVHRMQRCSVYDNASPDPETSYADSLFSAGGIAVTRGTVTMEQGDLSGNFGRGGGAAVRSAGALRLSAPSSATTMARSASLAGLREGSSWMAAPSRP
jgi:hypothetical protein